jgi:hypothetical protein
MQLIWLVAPTIGLAVFYCRLRNFDEVVDWLERRPGAVPASVKTMICRMWRSATRKWVHLACVGAMASASVGAGAQDITRERPSGR